MIAITPAVASQKMLIVSNLSDAARRGIAPAMWPPKRDYVACLRRELARQLEGDSSMVR
jgi:hypothetical protein